MPDTATRPAPAAIPAAAVAPERIAVGRVQKIGSEAKTPKAPNVSATVDELAASCGARAGAPGSAGPTWTANIAERISGVTSYSSETQPERQLQ